MMIDCRWAAAAAVCLCLYSGAARAQAGPPASALPNLVTVPDSVNLGATSFYDGFTTLNPGVTYIGYLRQNRLTAITDRNGDDVTAFRDPRIDVTTFVSQLSIASPLEIGGNRIGLDILVPITRIDASFGSGGPQLRDNGTAIGDITVGPFIQFKPILSGGRPIASVRASASVFLPSGSFDESRDINQSTGYRSASAYVSATVLPAPGWEISGRLNYAYNFETSNIPNLPPIPGFTFDDAKAGDLVYGSFTVSREISRGVSVGLNGFGLQQLADNRLNGITLADTKRSALYVGPGIHIDRLPGWGINANLYLPLGTENYTEGPQFNLMVIYPLGR